MNKKYILQKIKERINQLNEQYRKYFDTVNGPSKSVSGSACLRSRITKDLATLRLIEYCVMFCPDNFDLNSPDLEKAFDRLTEPRRLR